FTGQLTQLITVGQLYVGRHITSRHTSCGTTESVDSNPDGHEESNVEIDHHQHDGNQGGQNQSALPGFTLQSTFQVGANHAKNLTGQLIVMTGLGRHGCIVLLPGHLQSHRCNDVDVQLVSYGKQALFNSRKSASRRLRKLLRGFSGDNQAGSQQGTAIRKLVKHFVEGVTQSITDLTIHQCKNTVRTGRANHITGIGKGRSEEHTSELQSRENLVCRLLL